MTRPFLFALVLSLAATLPAQAGLRAWVDNPQVAPGETVRLTLAHDGQSNSRPDLGPLKQDFDIVGSSTSSQVQIVNGKVSSTTQLELSLAPKHGGPLTIPAITWDADHSQPLTLNVASNGGGTNNSGAGTAPSRVFVETEVSQKAPYVQAAVHVTVRVYTAVPLSHADLDFGDSDAALVRQVGSDGVSNVEKNGMSYQ
ncbi:MAG TPA: BatD family protein, partial [Steroidobacteraceae bacterium]